MSNSVLQAVIGGMFLILVSIGGWWVLRAESKFQIVDQLQFRSLYLNGQIQAAPVATPPVAPKPAN